MDDFDDLFISNLLCSQRSIFRPCSGFFEMSSICRILQYAIRIPNAALCRNQVFPSRMSNHLLSATSGSLSITYLPFATLTIGTPGIFLILLFRSLSFVATR